MQSMDNDVLRDKDSGCWFGKCLGGASFHLPVASGSRHLFHVQLFNCTAPLKCCLMFGNTDNDLLDGFDFRIK